MKEHLFSLLELQGIDAEADGLVRASEDYPAEITRIDDELEAARKDIQGHQEKMEVYGKASRLHERELEAAQLDLKKHQDRLYEVKTNREYDALQIEIEACRSRVTEQEDGILAAEEAMEQLQSNLQAAEETYKKNAEERLTRRQALQEKLAAIGEEVQKNKERRDQVRVHINPRLLTAYDRIRKGRTGLAVVRVVKNGACGGCFQEIPPQRVSEVRRNDRIILCESCGRILVWNGT